MIKQLRHHWALILLVVLQSLYCYASPIAKLDSDHHHRSPFSSVKTNEESGIVEPMASKTSNYLLSKNRKTNLSSIEFYNLDFLCALYGICNNEDYSEFIRDDDSKQKRLSSSLFHGIPKFGKRIFTSAFSGIPKFG
ncbi:unnamed protein product [Rotaria magnacalcarata]|uniref:Uncharacterized protein n=1 Tax=Rotaria magnacalcarata TaxID=392030 RepID=A0A819UIU0_9BILA|nr:unnamed protein product [Rotaria magnacalcarata]CAF4040710.1 unnamed protein product [Rotaria magnacalcarata]CAF4067047.1 unnamed protein product [Rotaria magnacalcarata]CAF4096137.1 unnamed protein product [Rotaria magnacalcarata]CAF4314105.1 unnamed protein product [Rotaria magnacalcarata]